MPSPASFESLLVARGTRSEGATTSQLDELTACHSAFPAEVLELLLTQNGEDSALTFGLGFRFLSASDIREAICALREMVEEDETLPPAFVEFIPFLHCEVKTEIGVFTSRSRQMPGEVVEYHFETGEFIRWAPSLSVFIHSLAEGAYQQIGCQFPADGQTVFDVSIFPPA